MYVDVYGYDENSQTVYIIDAALCTFCKECIYLTEDLRKLPEDSLAVEVKHSSNKFTFTVETNGSISAKDVVRYAFRELGGKIRRFQQEISTLKKL